MNTRAILLACLVVAIFFSAACTADVNGMPEPRSSSKSDIESGRRLIANYGCGSCHFITGVPGADSRAAPPLDRFYERTYIAGQLSNTEENLVLWIQNPQQIDPGNAMPDLGVSEEEAHDIAAYLYDYHPPTLGDLFRR
ncbi:MAG TPA: c-type cytochrome [Anaerolineales bacterium]|nr:c-type cytochrome [Anaerolineales bacterium]